MRLPALAGTLSILSGLFLPVIQAGEISDDDYEFAVRLFAEKDYRLALENFQIFLQKNPNHSKAPDALFKIALCYGQIQEYSKAAYSSSEFSEKYPDHELADAARFNAGYYSYLAQDYEAAARSFATYLEKSQNAELIPQALYWRAESLFELNRIPEAMALYQTIVDHHPQATFAEGELILPYAIYSIAFCQFRQHDYEGALANFIHLKEKIAADSPLQAEARWYIAECYFRLGRWEDALAVYQEIMDRYPTSDFAPEAMLGKALSELRLKKEEAEQTLEELMRRYPNSPAAEQAQIRLGDALVEKGKFAEARQRYQAFLQNEQNPRYSEALWGTAESFFREGKFAEAMPFYQKILALPPPNPLAEDAQLRLAFCYQQDAHYDEAIRLYTLVLETAKDHREVARVYLNRGICFKQKGDMSSAIADYEAAIEAGLIQEDHELGTKVYLEIGDYYLSQNQYAQALSAYQKVAECQPPTELNGSGLFGMALVAERQERYQEAAHLYEQFVQQYPHHPKVKQGLEGAADMYEKLGQKERATAFRNRVLELDPQALVPRLNLAIAAFSEKNFQRVVELLEPVQGRAAQDPYGAALWQTLGAAYFQLQQWDQAAAAYGKLATEFSASKEAEEALFWQGQAQFHNQQKEDAIRSLENFIQAHGNHPLSREARLLVSQIYREMGKLDQAIEILKPLTEDSQPEIAAGALYEAAWNLYDAGDKKGAIALWQEMVERFPGQEKSGYAQLHLAH
ncbi:MAG: tetratricopeptide repeat protein, partial [Candidatus Hadarchaeum sp.]